MPIEHAGPSCKLQQTDHCPEHVAAGGTTVAYHLKKHAAAHGWSHVVESSSEGAARHEHDASNHRANWSEILGSIRNATRPRLLVFVHVSSTLAVGRSAMLRQAVPPISGLLRAKGCKLVRSTTLRDPVARTASAAYYRGVAQVCTLSSAHCRKGPPKLSTFPQICRSITPLGLPVETAQTAWCVGCCMATPRQLPVSVSQLLRLRPGGH